MLFIEDTCSKMNMQAGFYLAQKFRGGNMGEVEVMDGPRGWVREGDVPPPARSVGSLSININVPIKAPK